MGDRAGKKTQGYSTKSPDVEAAVTLNCFALFYELLYASCLIPQSRVCFGKVC